MTLFYFAGNLALLILVIVLIHRSSLSEKGKTRGYIVFFTVMVLGNWALLWLFGRALSRM